MFVSDNLAQRGKLIAHRVQMRYRHDTGRLPSHALLCERW